MIHTMRSAPIIGGMVSHTAESEPSRSALKWRSSVVRNLTLSFASTWSFVSSLNCVRKLPMRFASPDPYPTTCAIRRTFGRLRCS